MTKQQIFYYACSAAILLAGAIYGIQSALRGSLSTTQNRTITIVYDQQIAQRLRKNLHDTLHDMLKKNIPAKTILETLKKNTPALKTITVDYRKPGYIKTRLVFDSPLCVIQQNQQTPLILSRAGYYAPYQHYTHDMVQGLPCILVHEQPFSAHSQQALYQWVTKLPHDFFGCYDIHWNKPTDIIILDHNHKNFEYRATCATRFTPAIEQSLAQLRKLYTEQKNKVKIDMRFKDQFIIEPLNTKKKGVL